MHGQTSSAYQHLLHAYRIVLGRMRSADLGLPAVCLALAALAAAPASAWAMDFIDLEYDDSVSDEDKAVFAEAEAMWESRITGFDSSATHRLTISVSTPLIDGSGNILGQAGPTDFITVDGYVYALDGMMQFDSADMADMRADGSLIYVIEHEMGHVLGIGTLWEQNNVYDGASGQYTGAKALAAWQAEFDQPGATFVPVELGGSGGTAHGHWNETDFGAGPTGFVSNITGIDFEFELMTGWANTPTYLSTVTLGSLADMGYIVDGVVTGPVVNIYTSTADGKSVVVPDAADSNVRILENGGPEDNTLAVAAGTHVLSLTQYAGTTAATLDMGGTGVLVVGDGGEIGIEVDARDLTIGAAANDGFVTAEDAGDAALVLRNRNADATLTVNAVIQDNAGGGAVAVEVNGNAGARAVLAGANTHSGGTTVTAGILAAGADNVLGTGDLAVETGATFDMAGFDQSTNGLDGAGTIESGGAATLTFGAGGVFPEISDFTGTLSETGGALTLVKTGDGLQRLAGTLGVTGTTTVAAGALAVDGDLSGSAVTVQTGGWLGGAGRVGSTSIEAGATLAPGLLASAVLTVAGDLGHAGDMLIDFSGDGGVAGTDFSQVAVTGTATLGGTLTLADLSGGAFAPTLGQAFVILDNQGAGAVVGTFAGLADGAAVSDDAGHDFRIFYAAGTGNDVVLFSTEGTATLLYANDQWVTADGTPVDGDLETAASEAALLGLNAFGAATAVADALASQPGFGGTLVVNGGTYDGALLAGGGGVTLQLVGDGTDGEAEIVLQDLSGDADDAIVTGFHGAGLGNLAVEQGGFAGSIGGDGDIRKTTGADLDLSGATVITGAFRLEGGSLSLGATGVVQAGGYVQAAGTALNLDATTLAVRVRATGDASLAGDLNLANLGSLAGVVNQVLIQVDGARTGGFDNLADGTTLATFGVDDELRYTLDYGLGDGNDIGITTSLDPDSPQAQSLAAASQSEMAFARQLVLHGMTDLEDRLAAHRRNGFFEDRAAPAAAPAERATAVDDASLPTEDDGRLPLSFYAGVTLADLDLDGGASGDGRRIGVGVDSWVDDDVLAGCQFSSGGFDWEQGADRGSSTDYRISLYGQFALRHALFLDVGGSVARLEATTTRDTSAGVQHGSIEGWDASLFGKLSWRAINHVDEKRGVRSRLEPYAGVRGAHTQLGAYTETGALPLRVSGQSGYLLQGFAGAAWSQWFDLSKGGGSAWGYHLRAEAFVGTAETTTEAAIFVGTATGGEVPIAGAAADTWGGRITAGLDFRTDGWTFSVDGGLDEGEETSGWHAGLSAAYWF